LDDGMLFKLMGATPFVANGIEDAAELPLTI
jgi:hypothetical protein